MAAVARRMEHPTTIRWGRVRGPATALHAIAWRLGWQVTAEGLLTHTGQLLRWGVDPPACFERAVEDAVINWRKANVLQTLAWPDQDQEHQQQDDPQPDRPRELNGGDPGTTVPMQATRHAIRARRYASLQDHGRALQGLYAARETLSVRRGRVSQVGGRWQTMAPSQSCRGAERKMGRRGI